MRFRRRGFLKLGLGAAIGTVASRAFPQSSWRVGVGRHANPYAAALRAVLASGEWPAGAIAGRTVVIKPNLVVPQPAASGSTTDPEVVRAVVDIALGDGAAEVIIAETSPVGAHFTACGYDGFATYDPWNRVRLVDLRSLPVTLAPVARGLAYGAIYTPDLLAREDVVYVTVAKLKTHAEALATLSLKNQFAVPAVDRYVSSPPSGRFAMHDRGVHQVVVDLNLLRPSHFAVIDGIVGMEGLGPFSGTPVPMNLVLAGRNALAVDRVALTAMDIPQSSVPHLAYASRLGLGPSDAAFVTTAGDALPVRPFALPIVPPRIEPPRVSRPVFRPEAGQTTVILTGYGERVIRSIEIARLSDMNPDVETIRTVAPWALRNAGFEAVAWDGRSDAGSVAPPGRYAVHVRAYGLRARVRHADAVGWVTVVP